MFKKDPRLNLSIWSLSDEALSLLMFSHRKTRQRKTSAQTARNPRPVPHSLVIWFCATCHKIYCTGHFAFHWFEAQTGRLSVLVCKDEINPISPVLDPGFSAIRDPEKGQTSLRCCKKPPAKAAAAEKQGTATGDTTNANKSNALAIWE